MSTKIAAKVENPEPIVITMTLTMTLGEWRMVAEVLKKEQWYPCARFAAALNDVIRKITDQVVERIEAMQ